MTSFTEDMVRRGMVPASALANIAARAVVNVDRISEIEATTDHDVIAFTTNLAENIGPASRFRWASFGPST